jgi:uncharacterized tellurite resistance protein B-like protein
MLDSLLSALGLRAASDDPDPAEPGTLRQIVARLERLPPERARYVAVFALVLSRVADADMDIGTEERERIGELLVERGGLSRDEAETVTDIAAARSRISGGTDHFLATRELAEISTREQREDLLDCLFSVSAADGSISTAEENRVRQIASELGFGHEDFARARSLWNEHREILKR